MTWDEIRNLLRNAAQPCFSTVTEHDETVLVTPDGQVITYDPNRAAQFLRVSSLLLPNHRAYLCIRSQRSQQHIAVQLVPPGVEPIKVLNKDRARKRGIVILYFGAGYREYTGPKSGYGRALAEARAFIRNSGHIDAGEF